MLSHPPLCFRGNKRNLRKFIINKLSDYIHENTEPIIVDLFGGSLYISYILKYEFPNLKIICNDYDNFRDRLQRASSTRELFDDLNNYTTRHNMPRKGKQSNMTTEQMNDIKNIMREHYEKYKYIDVIQASSAVLYSGNYAESFDALMNKPRFYNRIPVGPNIENVNDYLNVINSCEVVRTDYHDLYNKYKDVENVIFIADPPYLYTDKTGYTAEYWNLSDSLNVLNVLHNKCMYFTSPKSGTLELIEYINKEWNAQISYNAHTVNRGTLGGCSINNDEIIITTF